MKNTPIQIYWKFYNKKTKTKKKQKKQQQQKTKKKKINK